MTVDFASLLESLRTEGSGEGMRSEEIAELWGCSQAKAVRLLGKAKKQGLVRVTQKTITDLSDRKMPVTAYVVCGVDE